MKKRILFFLALLCLPLAMARAQRHIIVFDAEVSRPLSDVMVSWANGKADSTNIFGEVSLPERVDTLTLRKSGYVTLHIPEKWMEDSIPMIRDYNNLGEVVVYGEDHDPIAEKARQWTKEDRVEMELRHPITGIEFNIADLFNGQRRRDRKHARRLEKVFREMDADADPVVQSYRRALKAKLSR